MGVAVCVDGYMDSCRYLNSAPLGRFGVRAAFSTLTEIYARCRGTQ